MRPVCPFITFCRAKRDQVKAANPNAVFGDMGRLLYALWKDLSDSEKAAYRSDGGRDVIDAVVYDTLRPGCPFITFCHAKRDQVKAANPNAAFGDTGRLLYALWKDLSESEKEAYRRDVVVDGAVSGLRRSHRLRNKLRGVKL